MQRTALSFLIAGGLCVAGTLAHAEPFVAASVGQARFEDFCTNMTSCDRSDTGWTVRGGYRFSPWLALEARYFDLGTGRAERGGGVVTVPVAAESFATSQYAWRGAGANLTVSWPLSERFALSGLVGVARVEREDRYGGYTVPASGVELVGLNATARATKPYYGVAASWDVSPAVALSLEANRYRGVNNEDIDLLAAGLTFRFR
jgi:hypothetical protein